MQVIDGHNTSSDYLNPTDSGKLIPTTLHRIYLHLTRFIDLMKPLGKFPDYQVFLSGTTVDGVYEYIESGFYFQPKRFGQGTFSR